MPLSLNNNASNKDITKLVLFLKELLKSNTLIGCFNYRFNKEDDAKIEYIIEDYKSNSNIIVFNENIHMNTYIFSSDIDYTNVPDDYMSICESDITNELTHQLSDNLIREINSSKVLFYSYTNRDQYPPLCRDLISYAIKRLNPSAYGIIITILNMLFLTAHYPNDIDIKYYTKVESNANSN